MTDSDIAADMLRDCNTKSQYLLSEPMQVKVTTALQLDINNDYSVLALIQWQDNRRDNSSIHKLLLGQPQAY